MCCKCRTSWPTCCVSWFRGPRSWQRKCHKMRGYTQQASVFQDSILTHAYFPRRTGSTTPAIQSQGERDPGTTAEARSNCFKNWHVQGRLMPFIQDCRQSTWFKIVKRENRSVTCLEHSVWSKMLFTFGPIHHFVSLLLSYIFALLFLVCCNVFHVSSGANRSTCSVWTAGHRCMVDADGWSSKEMMPMLVRQWRRWLFWARFKFENGRERILQTTFCKQWFCFVSHYSEGRQEANFACPNFGSIPFHVSLQWCLTMAFASTDS